jgi:hypothetical protein
MPLVNFCLSSPAELLSGSAVPVSMVFNDWALGIRGLKQLPLDSQLVVGLSDLENLHFDELTL